LAAWDCLKEEAADQGLHGFHGEVVFVDVIVVFGQARALDGLG